MCQYKKKLDRLRTIVVDAIYCSVSVLYEIWMLWYCSIFTTSTGSVQAVEDHSVRKYFGGGFHGKGGSIHMSCFYSNCWPGAWVSDYCLSNNLQKSQLLDASSAATKLCTSASTKWCRGRDEASFHRDRLNFLCYSSFLYIRDMSTASCTQARCSRNTKILATLKTGSCQVVLCRSRPFKTFLDLLLSGLDDCKYSALTMCYNQEHVFCI